MRMQAAWLVAGLAASGLGFAQTNEESGKSDAERRGAMCAAQAEAGTHGHGMRERKGGSGGAGLDGAPGAHGHGDGCPMRLAGESCAQGKPQGGAACGGAAGGKGEMAQQRGRGTGMHGQGMQGQGMHGQGMHGQGMHGQGMHGQGMHGGGAEIAPAPATPAPK